MVCTLRHDRAIVADAGTILRLKWLETLLSHCLMQFSAISVHFTARETASSAVRINKQAFDSMSVNNHVRTLSPDFTPMFTKLVQRNESPYHVSKKNTRKTS